MSRKERVVAAIRRVIAAERVLAGVLLAVAVAGAVLIPRLLVGPSPQHELGVGAPSMTGPPVVLAPSLPDAEVARAGCSGPAESRDPRRRRPVRKHVSTDGSAASRDKSRCARAAASHAASSSASTPRAAGHPPPTPHALAPTRLAPKTTTCNGTFSGTGKDVVVPSGATCVLVHGTAITHDLTVSPAER